MANLNSVILIGRICFEPAVKPVGKTTVCTLRIATSRSYKKAEEWVEETTFVDVTTWGNLAEKCKAMPKGASVVVEGRLSGDEWLDKDSGKKRTKLFVTADRVQFAESKGKAAAQEQGGDGEPSIPF